MDMDRLEEYGYMIYRWFLKSGSNSAVRLNTIDKRLDRCEINGLS
jgi:hypothetical protein